MADRRRLLSLSISRFLSLFLSCDKYIRQETRRTQKDPHSEKKRNAQIHLSLFFFHFLAIKEYQDNY